MKFEIQIVECKETKNKKNSRGGSFNAIDLVFKKDGGVKAQSFPDWANQEVYPYLQKAQVGNTYTVVTSEEKINGYWKWLQLQEGSTTPSEQQVSNEKVSSTAASGSTEATSRPVNKSNWETTEERAKRQVMIVRQSSISSAVALKPKADIADILDAARQFEAYVLGE